MRSLTTCVLIGSIAAVTTGSEAAVTVYRDNGIPAGVEDATVTLNALTGGWDVVLNALYNPSGETVYEVRGTGGEVIDNVFIDVPCWQDADGNCVPAGSPLYVHIVGADAAGISVLHNVEQRGTAETLLLTVDVNGTIGSITAEVIGTVTATGDILGPIISTTPNNATRGVYWVEADGDLLGDVIAEHGRIQRIWAHGDIGTAQHPVTLHAKHKIQAIFAGEPACLNDWVWGNPVTCGGNIYADIDTHVNDGTGRLFRFFAWRFDGTFRAPKLMNSSGMPGEMMFVEGMDGTIMLDGGFSIPGQHIDIGAGGLTGQILFNTLDDPNAQWTSAVNVGPYTLTGADYDVPASELGGGGAGVFPYGLHHASCDPPSGTALSPEPGVVTLALRHYGPVGLAGPAPVMMERRVTGSVFYQPVATDAFLFEIDEDDPATMDVTGPFESGFQYRMFATDVLRATALDEADDAPPVEWADWYRVTIEHPTCPGDVDGNGTIDVVDLVGVLVNWGPTSSDIAADIDDDGVVDLHDLLFVLSAWGDCS